MSKRNWKPRHLVEKPQKSGRVLYYWQPSARLRAANFLPIRLSDDRTEAFARAEALNREVDAWRRGLRPAQGPKPNALPRLVRLYRKSLDYTDLSERTRRDYDRYLGMIEAWSARGGHPPLDKMRRAHVQSFLDEKAATPAEANYLSRVLRLLLAFAVRQELLDRNPASGIRLHRQRPRDRVATDDEVAALCQAAIAAGRPSIGLAVLLGVNLLSAKRTSSRCLGAPTTAKWSESRDARLAAP